MGIKYDNNVGPMIVDDTTGKVLGYVDAQGNKRYLDGRGMADSESGTGQPVGGGVVSGRVSLTTHGVTAGRVVEDAVLSSGSKLVDSATAAFEPSDVGARFTVCDQANLANRINGTITQVLSATRAEMSATSSFAATGCGFAIGPDNSGAIASALGSLSVSGKAPVLSVPMGVYLTTSPILLSDGQSIEGAGCDYGLSTTPIGAGSALVLASSIGVGAAFVQFGSASNAFTSGRTRSRMAGVGIDAANNAGISVMAQCRRGRIVESQVWRGSVETLRITGQNQEVWDSVIGAHNTGNVVGVRTGDVKIQRNQVRQGGVATLTASSGHQIYVAMSGQMNTLIANNHFWSGFNGLISDSYRGSNVMIHAPAGTSSPAFLATISGNLFDSTYGPQLTIRNEGSSRLSQINITGNQFFQTSGYVDAAFPVISLQPISGSIRGVTVSGSTGNGNSGNFSAFAAVEATYGGTLAGALSHSSFSGNAVQNCNELFLGFTPEAHASNVISPNYTTTVQLGDNAGRATFSGTGAQTTFTIPHGLSAAPSALSVSPGSVAAVGSYFATADATNITVTYTSAPGTGTNNVTLNWSARI